MSLQKPWTRSPTSYSLNSKPLAQVKVKANAPSLVEEGKQSMVSDPMDAHVKYDKSTGGKENLGFRGLGFRA